MKILPWSNQRVVFGWLLPCMWFIIRIQQSLQRPMMGSSPALSGFIFVRLCQYWLSLKALIVDEISSQSAHWLILLSEIKLINWVLVNLPHLISLLPSYFLHSFSTFIFVTTNINCGPIIFSTSCTFIFLCFYICTPKSSVDFFFKAVSLVL